VPVADPARDNEVVKVLRPGFRTEHAVLRYAEVSVGQYASSPPAAGTAAAEVDGTTPAVEPLATTLETSSHTGG